jgi:plasmid stabilization system protein ParE
MLYYTRSEKAEKDLKGIWRHIANEGSRGQADKFLDKLGRTMQKLADSPGMGTCRDHLEPGLLGFPEGNYMIY